MTASKAPGGPSLDRLTHRLSECPRDFLEEPRIGRRGTVHVDAVVSDLLVDLGGEPLRPKAASAFTARAKSKRNHLRLMLVCCWLLHDEWFQKGARFYEKVPELLTGSLKAVAQLVDAELFVSDPDRREELVRLSLNSLGLIPEGETKPQAQDRWKTLSSVERHRVLKKSEAQRKRAKKLQEAMRKKRAAEAAARYSRE